MKRFSIGLFLCLVGSADAAIIYVPDDYPTIQGAIDAAVNGDAIIVRAGTYVENIDFVGKAINLKSQSGPDDTIIDGNQAGSVVTFQNGEVLDSVLDGFTVKNGASSSGGGIHCYFSSPTVMNNTISENTDIFLVGEGGGLYCDNSSPIINGYPLYVVFTVNQSFGPEEANC